MRLHDEGVPTHVPAVDVTGAHPGTVEHELLEREEQAAVDGVPVQCGPVEKVMVAPGRRVRADLQQICPEQSLLTLHDFGHDLLQMPLQQISPAVVLQSVDWPQALGQAA